MTKYPAENDVAVLLIFFTRQETLKRTFEAIKKARPSHLYLYQDGPRNEVEAQKIEAAKRIVADEEIDWECEVQRNYHTENSGAWASNYQAQRWAFSLHDKCIMIAGYNHEEKTEAPYDYLFTSVFSIWGWASWSRVVNQWDDHYKVVDSDFDMHQLEALVKAHGDREEMIKKLRKHKETGDPIYETVYWSYNMLHSGLTIVPTRNMIQNTAVSEESAHFQSAMKTLPKRIQQLLTMPSYEMTFPLRHRRFPYAIRNMSSRM